MTGRVAILLSALVVTSALPASQAIPGPFAPEPVAAASDPCAGHYWCAQWIAHGDSWVASSPPVALKPSTSYNYAWAYGTATGSGPGYAFSIQLWATAGGSGKPGPAVGPFRINRNPPGVLSGTMTMPDAAHWGPGPGGVSYVMGSFASNQHKTTDTAPFAMWIDPVGWIRPQQFAGPGGNLNQNDPTGKIAEPVNTFSGNYTTQSTDLAMPGRGIPFAFVRSYNSVVDATGPLGRGWTHPYNVSLEFRPDGSVDFNSDDGAVIPFGPASGGYAPGKGVLSTLANETGGYVVTRPDQLRYHFDTTGRLTSESDRNGNAISFSYTSGDLTTITDSVGRTIDLTYDPAHRLTEVRDPLDRAVGYTYDATGRLETVTDVRGGIVTYTYDPSGRLESIVDANDHTVVTNTYGTDGRVTAQLDARGKETTFAWDPITQVATTTDPRGGVTLDTYAGAALMSRRDGEGGLTRFAYDAAHNRTSVTDPRGNITTMTYDGRGNVLTVTAPAPLSYRQTFTYDPQNNLLTATDGRNHTTTNEYDADGNLVRTTYADGTSTEYTRDPAGTGLLESVTDQRDKTTLFGYDAQANVTTVTAPGGEVASMSYDAAGRLTGRVDPRGNAPGADPADYETVVEFDAADHLVSSTDPLGNLTAFSFDPAGNRTSATDPNDHATTYGYDAANHLTSVTDADGKVTAYAYDDSGNLASRTDANEHATTWSYDLANRLISMIDPLDHEWTIGYDANGNPATKTDANGNTTSFTYDGLDRLTSITYANSSTPAVAFAYNANGDRVAMTDGAGSESYAFDALDRLVEVTRGVDSFAYTYDAAGNLLTREYPDGTSTAYAYDDDGRMANATTEPYPRPADASAPTTPTGLTASLVGTNQINLAWTGSTDAVGVQGYKLYRDGTYLASVGPVGSTSFSDTGLGVGVTHTYRVSAIDAAANESAQSGPAAATTTPLDTTAPSVPTGVAATAAAWNRVTLSWAASTDDRAVTAYQVYRGGVLVSTVGGAVTTFTDRDTDASTAYSYTIKALDAATNASAASAPRAVTTGACSSCITTTTFNAVADAYVSNAAGEADTNFGTATPLRVTATDDRRSYAKFDLSTLPAGTVTSIVFKAYSTVADSAGFRLHTAADSSWTESGITYTTAPSFDAATYVGSPAAGTNAYVSVTAPNAWFAGRTVQTWVMAKSTTSNGTYQSREATNKPQLVVKTYARPADASAPTTPTGLTASLVGTNQINLAWTGSTDAVGVQGYKLYRDGTYLASVGPVGSTSFSDTGLGVGVTHTYRVSAIDAAANESAQSGPAAATTTPLDTTAPSVPTGVAATAAAWNRVTLSWAASTDDRAVTAYQVYRGGVLVSTVGGSVTAFTDRDTDASTAYSYTVKALDAATNASAASAAANVTTKAAPTLSASATYTYDAAGNLLTETSADGITATYTYDRAGRLLELANVSTSGTLSRFTYGLDPAGNRTSLTTTRGNQYFTYDVLNRLTGVCYDASCAGGQTPQPCLGCVGSPIATPAATTVPDSADLFTTYTYDPVGNRLTETTHLGATTYDYDAADRLITRTPPGGPAVAYGYDDNGNQTSAGSSIFAYDLGDRLRSATVGATTETYGYAGDGVRLSASRGPSDSTGFVVDRNFALPQVAQERDGSGDAFRTYTYGLSAISQAAATGVAYLHHDPLGSISDLTSATGASLAWTEYQPFGAVRLAGLAAGASSSPFGFTGQYLDGNTGLYHLRARQYDPATGRFTAVDPVARSIDHSYIAAYAYADANPVRYLDPSGLFTVGVCVTGGLSFGPIGFGFDLCVSASSSGQLGITGTTQAAGGVGLGAYGGIGGQVSNGDDLSDLSGPFAAAGGSGVLGVGVQGSIFGGPGHCGQPVNGAQGAVVVGGGASAFGAAQVTGVAKLAGPPDSPCSAAYELTAATLGGTAK